MGQYYKPVLLTKNNQPIKTFNAHDFGSGLKLMEHSWRLNSFVRFVEKHLVYKPTKIVWAGDYADNEKDMDKNLYELADDDTYLINHPLGESVSQYDYTKFNKAIKPHIVQLRFKYLVNHDKKEFVNKDKAPNNDGWQIHALPLLTCEGNDRGGGDYRPASDGTKGNVGLIGAWARDTIEVVSCKRDIPKDYTEIIFDLSE